MRTLPILFLTLLLWPALALADAAAGKEKAQICTACHGLDGVVRLHLDKDGWEGLVSSMVSNGAQLFPEEVETVTKYLSSHFTVDGSAGAKK